jgi:hypothetical protein
MYLLFKSKAHLSLVLFKVAAAVMLVGWQSFDPISFFQVEIQRMIQF